MSIEKHIEFVKNVTNQMQIFTTGLKRTLAYNVMNNKTINETRKQSKNK